MTGASPASTTYRRTFGETFLLQVCAALLALLTLLTAAAALGGVGNLRTAFFALAPLAAVSGWFGVRIANEAVAASRLMIAIGEDSVTLRLPARRGHVRLPAIEERAPLHSIVAVETRSEAFSQLGIAAVQQAWRLKLSDGRAIDLGADRQMKRDIIGPAARDIAARRGLAIRDFGMIDGAAGFLAFAGTSVPDWSARSLEPGEIEKRRDAAERALALMTAGGALLMLARLFVRR